MSDRAAYLSSLLGRPWSPERSCWHVAREIEAALFGVDLPDHAVPDDPSWRWMIEAIAGDPERERWSEVHSPHPHLVTAPDGALVAMGRADRAAHIGVWLAPERAVIHADQVLGTLMEDVPTLKAGGWGRLRFYCRNDR
ncbi:hypothetical protein [Ancylobacter mangrovi]|uniref:hypothetical protein n=1 Tax=Ancylobacter mangrovi TaxID=2972472 RepID=UPI002161D499|nr:hypothetical protein [Ancylobacter mangrovi]MCS0501374.1 hypothetical protein [Ancylobacter mangrovi]